MALLRNCGKILLSGTYPSSKDPGGKLWFFLQISNIWVWHDIRKALKPLFDLQEAQGKTSNMTPKPTFRRFWDIFSQFLLWLPVPPKWGNKINHIPDYLYKLVKVVHLGGSEELGVGLDDLVDSIKEVFLLALMANMPATRSWSQPQCCWDTVWQAART